MKKQFPNVMLTAAAVAVVSAFWLNVDVSQAQDVSADDDIPRTPLGNPDLNGIWQTNNEAHWGLERREARVGPLVEAGAHLAVPPSMGFVEGGRIPYKPEMREQQRQNQANWLELDPATKCYLPGVPRATYQPYPFQIFQAPDVTLLTYQFAGADRMVYMNEDSESQVDSWMGHNTGHWEGDTLVIETTGQIASTWFDRSGNFHSGWEMTVEERYTMVDENTIQYEATIDDPITFEEPWTISMPIYRRQEPNMQLLEFKCVEFVEELMYGHLRAPGSMLGDGLPGGIEGVAGESDED
ncbi:MAG: hypothetical protein ACQETO_12255 [Pseudomonadota bacterium]